MKISPPLVVLAILALGLTATAALTTKPGDRTGAGASSPVSEKAFDWRRHIDTAN